MQKLSPDSLMTLEAYAKARKEFRAQVIAHKKNRTVHLGEHVTLLFEDALTIRYQVQEMLRVEGCPRVYAIADEDLERENEHKTSSVHFLRFELTPEMCDALKYGVSLAIGIDHPHYTAAAEPVPPEVRTSLVKDLA